MIYEPSVLAVGIFAAFVGFTLWLSFYLAAQSKSAQGYFAAGGSIHWFVNGIAFAGDYLSAASFLGICGMIAFYGYDGFLYSIGYLAGWIVALFVIAEPLKRMGRYTFADALDSRFNSRGIKLTAAISTLAVSIFYLIPQMVGAGVLIRPLLGFPHAVGVVLVGVVVTLIVVTAGMVSTTYVQFLKGSLLVIFSTVLTVLILNRGLNVDSRQAERIQVVTDAAAFRPRPEGEEWTLLPKTGPWAELPYVRMQHNKTGAIDIWRELPGEPLRMVEAQMVTKKRVATQKTINLAGITAGGEGQGLIITAGEGQGLTVTAVSSDTALIPNPTIVYTSPSSKYTSMTNIGTATITVTVRDRGLDGGAGNADGSGRQLRGMLEFGELKYTPMTHKSGTATITVTVRDRGLDGVAGNADDAVAAFPVTVKVMNDPPPLNVNGLPIATKAGSSSTWQQRLETGTAELFPVGEVTQLPAGTSTSTGPLGPLQYLSTMQQSEINLWKSQVVKEADGATTTVYYPEPTAGKKVLRPGNLPAFKGLQSDKLMDKLNFLSLMLALFGGTASLPHILIRYYTVKDQAAARKSTIVGIASIGFFYVLTLFIGLGAMTSGALDVTNSNMAAPLLARSFSELLFAIISAIAFTTVLGTVSGLIIAASGAVVHDLMSSFLRIEMTDHVKIRSAKLASVVVGAIAIVLGIVFEKMNVSYLVGWAFSVAASANLPSLVMLLFWKRTTKQGITAAITVGMVTSLAWILLSGDTYKDVYGLKAEEAIVPFSQPGIVTIPLGFAVLILVSLFTTGTARPEEARA